MKTVKFTNPLWQQMYEYMLKRASKGKLVTYKEMADHFGVDCRGANLGGFLGDISYETYTRLGFLISAVVVLKESGAPSDGFFKLAAECGDEFDDEDLYWVEQVSKARDYATQIAKKQGWT